MKRPRWEIEVCQLAAMMALAVYVINLGYGFTGSFKPLGSYRFQSRVLSGEPLAAVPKTGNRFAGGWLARLPVPLPRDYLQGIDRQRTDFEVGDRSYFHGQWRHGGWWYYYLVGLGIKTPLGTWVVLALAVFVTAADIKRAYSWRGCANLGGSAALSAGEQAMQAARSRATWRDEVALLAPLVAILVLTSSQTGFTSHVRYAIPALPYLFVWCGRAAAAGRGRTTEAGKRRRPIIALLAWISAAASAAASLSAYPHSISFFNALVGGSARGDRWLLDSNLAWGQDVVFLKEWIDRHPEARPLRIAATGWLGPGVLGIDYTLPPVGPARPVTNDDRARMASGAHQRARGSDAHAAPHHDGDQANRAKPARAKTIRREAPRSIPQSWEDVVSLDDLGPQPGWYVIDVNFLHGNHWPAARPNWRFQTIAQEDLNYKYFRCFEPCDRVAYSYLVYHITREAADTIRRELGLPPLRGR